MEGSVLAAGQGIEGSGPFPRSKAETQEVLAEQDQETGTSKM
jgi:hypothetical protein